MASTYSTLKIELIATGEQSGLWGDITNTNLGTALEEAIVGRANVPMTGDTTLTLADSNLTQTARNYILDLTGILSGNSNLIVPTIDKPYIIENNTTGGYSVTVKTSGGTGITVPNGKRAFVYANSTNVVSALDYVPSITTPSATITGGAISGITDLAVGDGGTGASTAADARVNLDLEIGVDVQAYNAALASIAGLTTATDKTIYTTASNTYAVTGLTSAGRALIDDATAADQRATLGLGTAATMTGPSGAIVGTTDTQTLENKSLTSPTITGTATLTGATLTAGTFSSPTFSGTPSGVGVLTATASQTANTAAINFTSIPSWVKKITVMLDGVSTGGVDAARVQLGTGGTPTYVTSGYSSTCTAMSSSSTAVTNYTDGFPCERVATAAATIISVVTITNITGNTWLATAQTRNSSSGLFSSMAGGISLGAALTAVRVVADGVTAFDAGTINIFYE